MNVRFWTCVLIFAPICSTYKILVVSPFPSKSHSILGDGYVNILLEAGHEITYVTGFQNNISNPLLHQIDVTENEKYFPFNKMDIKVILNKEVNVNDASLFLPSLANLHKETLKNKEVRKMLNDPGQKFDLVIAEWMFSELYSGLSAVFECPLIWFSSMEPHFMILRLIGEPSNPAYTSFTLSYNTAPFTFTQRVEELFLQAVSYILSDWSVYYKNKENYEHIFGPAMAKRGKPLPLYEEIRYNASLILGNSHASLGEAIALPQGYKPIAGYHINSNVKPLPKNLQTIMDNATNGVVYFSLGTIIKSRDMPDLLKHQLLKIFSNMKQTVLWKFEEDFPNLPKNVHVLKFAPQQSILRHPNCLLFITHGGLLSTTEAVHFAVPIIGISVFGDQHVNVQRAVNKGFAMKVDLSYNMAEDLDRAIKEMLGNPRYRNRVKDLSFAYHHRPATPQAEILHWVEHVAMTRGAPHLRSPALAVAWYQKLYLDLLALLLAALYLILIIFKKIVSLYWRGKRSDKKKIN
ncbi:unnamed protein product, partial [Iphiclides podalirius]